MIYLVGSIILTSYLTLSFKIVERFNINTFQTIVFNYITCVITGSMLNGAFPISFSSTQQPWFPWAILMGTIFISLFNLVGITAQKIGVAVATVANKLSLVVPFLFSIFFLKESFGWIKLTGLIFALLAVALTCMRSRSNEPLHKNAGFSPSLYYLLPLVVFLGSGVLDTMIKYVEQSFLHETNYNSYLITAFASAACIGILLLFYFVVTGRQRLSWKALLAGMCIGIPNYFSIWCLLIVLKANTGNSSAIIPINNMGIVLFSTVTAWLLYKEKLSLVNWTGITLSILSIALIAYG